MSLQDKLTPFSTPGRAFVKTLVMTTGEFEFDTLFINTVEGNDDGGQLPTLYFSGAAYFLWIVFIILMPVLFNNLLVVYICNKNVTYCLLHRLVWL